MRLRPQQHFSLYLSSLLILKSMSSSTCPSSSSKSSCESGISIQKGYCKDRGNLWASPLIMSGRQRSWPVGSSIICLNRGFLLGRCNISRTLLVTPEARLYHVPITRLHTETYNILCNYMFLPCFSYAWDAFPSRLCHDRLCHNRGDQDMTCFVGSIKIPVDGWVLQLIV